jgi:hypothetical protein
METENFTGFWDHMIPIIQAFKPALEIGFTEK